MDELIEQAIKNCKINKYEKYFEQVCKEFKCLLEAESKHLNLADAMPSLPLEVISLLKQVRFTFSNYESGTIGKRISEDADGLLKQYVGNGA